MDEGCQLNEPEAKTKLISFSFQAEDNNPHRRDRAEGMEDRVINRSSHLQALAPCAAERQLRVTG